MKPKRFFFHQTRIFGQTLSCGVPLAIGFMVFVTGLDADAGDILRGGGGGGGAKPRAGTNGGTPTPAASNAARANARDMLARTNRTLDSMRAMQNAARIAAGKGANHLGKNPANPTITLPRVPNGLVTGGLQYSPSIAQTPSKWTGAKLPTQTVGNGKTKVTIKQTEQQALLTWETFNIGKKTTLTFDQSKGGENVGQWIAFNKVSDPSANPTQILGNIKADGQVYIINPNGIIFGGSSQVNARGLTVSSLPINDNLVSQGLLNNRDAQFLFSGLTVPGGADGTPDFNPEAPPAITGKYGDIVVQEGAVLKSPASSGGNGGRIMLVGPNVTNKGTISTEAGQTILAAGLQVAVAAHDGDDPSLRGLDVWVGAVGDYAGTATNSGLIETLTGSISVAGKTIDHSGVMESSTSVNLNGRVDLKASYGAVANPNFDSATEQGSGGPAFFNQFTGNVNIQSGSLIRILPEYASKRTVPGTELPVRSQVNIEGFVIHAAENSDILLPNGLVSLRAGTWPYHDINNDRTIFDANGDPEANLQSNFSAGAQRFLFDAGQVYISSKAAINVAGTTEVSVPISHSILDVELRGAELADSPLQRDSAIRGVGLKVDLRNTGAFNGKFWVGTPLGDASGLAGLVERNAAQLTVKGGEINIQAGESIVVREASTIDVSGGYMRHQGGDYQGSFLVEGNRLVDVRDATPDRKYDAVFNGTSVFESAKWGVSETYVTPLFGKRVSGSFVEGASGGNLTLSAPSMVVDGTLRGNTIKGPRQRSSAPASSSLKLNIQAGKLITDAGGAIGFIDHSPTPPAVIFSLPAQRPSSNVPDFGRSNTMPVPLPEERIATLTLAGDIVNKSGFETLGIYNPDGTITVGENISLSAPQGGAFDFSASNISVFGSLTAPGGKISCTTFNVSPSLVAESAFLNPSGAPFPAPQEGRGNFILGSSALISAAGLVSDDRLGSSSPAGEPIMTQGGSVSIRSFDAELRQGAVIDVSGGVHVSGTGGRNYGKGGSIAILAGSDPNVAGVVGGDLTLESTLRGFSGTTGGTLEIKATQIEIGGDGGPGALSLSDSFFDLGGFSGFSLTGIGRRSDEAPIQGLFESYEPAITIAGGARIEPRALNFIAEESSVDPGRIVLQPFLNEASLRTPVNLSFTALGSDDPFTVESLEIRGDLVMGEGSTIRTEPGGSVAFKGGTVTLEGSVFAPGGRITVSGSSRFPMTGLQREKVQQALPTVHLSQTAVLSAAGAVVPIIDVFGKTTGTLFGGGSISVQGNILAENGSLIDASGASGWFDLDPTHLASAAGNPINLRRQTSGLITQPLRIQSTRTRLDSNGGEIDLSGSEMLLSDAQLKAESGGPTAEGGRLVISSGRFYRNNNGVEERRTGADINLLVTQEGTVIPQGAQDPGVGIGLIDQEGNPYGNQGYFSLERFHNGGFHSLSLGGKYFENASPVPFGGNVQFSGNIHLDVSGELRLAAGGVLLADGTVSISASHLSIGQEFRNAQNPQDVFNPFEQSPAFPSLKYDLAPTAGTGSLSFKAKLIDVGNLSLQNIAETRILAGNGEIRGNGTLSAAGDLTLRAGQIYPTSLASFDIFAYDHSTSSGSITIQTSGAPLETPLSVGGKLGVYATNIIQDGRLSAPIGRIRLGWTGADLDSSGTDFDAPRDIIAGSVLPVPITKVLTLGPNSLTSLSAATGEDDQPWVAPFGITPEGQTWVDPRGVNVTVSGLPNKTLQISGAAVDMKAGAVVDLRGGGDLLAYRWIRGNGGTIDRLGSTSTSWSSGATYESGSLVSFNGETWSARVEHSGQKPVVSPYWSKVADSYAILPKSQIAYSPINDFNTGEFADALSGDSGFTDPSLRVGDTVVLEGSKGLPAGEYTLLPRRYALLKGAFLVTPLEGAGLGSVEAPDGASRVSGYLANGLSTTDKAPSDRIRFEIAPTKVINQRAEYNLVFANKFLGGVNESAGGTLPQILPSDGGRAVFHGDSALRLAGRLRSSSPGLGSIVDVSSFSDITLGSGAGTTGNAVSLNTAVLSKWNVDSLLIGGIRTGLADGSSILNVKTDRIQTDPSGNALIAKDIVLAANGSLEIGSRSSISAKSEADFIASPIIVPGNSPVIRISSDANATTSRTDVSATGQPLVEIAKGADLRGASILIDSTFGTKLDSSVVLTSRNLTLGSGQISLLLDGYDGKLTGSEFDSHLVLAGNTLNNALAVENLTLRSYGTVDLYGEGRLPSDGLQRLDFSSRGIRGFGVPDGSIQIGASKIVLTNPIESATPSVAPANPGRLELNAKQLVLGGGSFSISGFKDVGLTASENLLFEGTGTFNSAGRLRIGSPIILGGTGAEYSIVSQDSVVLDRVAGDPVHDGSLGASLTIEGSSVSIGSDIVLPSGILTVRATGGDINVSGLLSVNGTSASFDDLARFTDAGSITLQADAGDVLLSETSEVSVAAASGGGNAGTLEISSPMGEVSLLGRLVGDSSPDFLAGGFTLDSAFLSDGPGGSLASINESLNAGNFTRTRAFRIRNEQNVVIDHVIRSSRFSLAADIGSISVTHTGKIDASGTTGGAIALAAHGDLILHGGSELTVAGLYFNHAGKGGSILLEAGTQRDGVANTAANLRLDRDATIDLSVREHVDGRFDQPGSSAFNGRFQGTLHLRAPRTSSNTDLGIGAIESSIIGASHVLAEGFLVYLPVNGTLNIAQRNKIDSDSRAFLGEAGVGNANEVAMRSRLLAGSATSNLASLLVIAPGSEIINPDGNLTLGLANPTGSNSNEARSTADWDLSLFRYGSRSAPGVLTLRAGGDLVFNNTLSDGFVPTPVTTGQEFADQGHSRMWLGTLMTVSESLPVNLQSWSYRLTAGADTDASGFGAVMSRNQLETEQPGKGSVIVGEFYPAVPNLRTDTSAAAIGTDGQTADTIRISSSPTNRGTRFEVIRTGTGDISVTAGRDVQLRNQFATIYTAGVGLPDPSTIVEGNDFVLPTLPTTEIDHPSQSGSGGGTLGIVQQLYPASWSLAGGNVSISAENNIGRYWTVVDGVLQVDSSRQMPNNWLYRRGYVAPATGLFAEDGGFGDSMDVNNARNINDKATSTTWWIDFSNFFEGVGTLGGGNVDLRAGNDVVNVDAVAPTNARMPGRRRNPDFGSVPGAPEFLNLAPDEARLHELGGGDVKVIAGRNIDGGVYYVEKGKGTLIAGGEITTNQSRSPSLGILDGSAPFDPLTWLPTTLFVGKSSFDVSARGDVLLGPATNPFLLPQGINNKFWYKSYFNTFSPDSGVNVLSLGGSVTHRAAVTLPGATNPTRILETWFDTQLLFNGSESGFKSSNYQPWLRLAELGLGSFGSIFEISAPSLSSTAFSGDINLVGNVTLYPATRGNLELAAKGNLVGLQDTGSSFVNGQAVRVWTSSRVNLSDADPASIPGIASPLAYQTVSGRSRVNAVNGDFDILESVKVAFEETGGTRGAATSLAVKQALHATVPIHLGDPNPVRLYSTGGDITGLTLFSSKKTQITAGRDIVDVSFYVQNLSKSDVSLVSAGRDILPFSENSSLRALANDLSGGNYVGDPALTTLAGNQSNAMVGDIQLGGPGVIEILSGRMLDLGTGANYADGTGVGITSIGNLRNPALPFAGGDLIVLAGLATDGTSGAALGLSGSSLKINEFMAEYLKNPDAFESEYLSKLGKNVEFDDLTSEQQAIVTLERFYDKLWKAGNDGAKTGDFDAGYELIKAMFGKGKPPGDILTRSREIRTVTGGSISISVPGGNITMATDVFGNPLAPPGIVTEYGGSISTFTNGNVDIGQARIFTLRGGDINMWSSNGNIAAGSSPRTVVTAPPTRVIVDVTSAEVQTDLGGLATGGGIGVLAAVEGVKAGSVGLFAPKGFVDAGDAGIRATGDIQIGAQVVLNAGNISSGGSTTGAAVSAPAAPSVSTVTSASNTAAATTTANESRAEQQQAPPPAAVDAPPSIYSVEVIGYGGGGPADEEEDEEKKSEGAVEQQ